MEKYKKIGIAKIVLVALMLVGVLLVSIWIHEGALGHENDKYEHGYMPPCYGWEKTGINVRKCYLNKEQTECVNLIYTHGTWHVTLPYVCDEVEVLSSCEEDLFLNNEEEVCGGE